MATTAASLEYRISTRRLAVAAALGLAVAACAGSKGSGPTGTGGGAGGSGGSGPGGAPAQTGGSGGSPAGGSGGGGAGGSQPAPDAAPPSGSDAASGSEGGVPSTPPPVAIPDDLPPCQKMIMVSDGAGLTAAIGKAGAGDCILAADGMYGGVTIGVKGSAEHPVVIRAVNRGKAVFGGAVLMMGATWVVIEGFDYTAGVSIVDANHNRITRGTFRMTAGTYVNLSGSSDGNRLDHCDLGGLTGTAEGHFVTPTGLSTNTRIDHNFFHDNAPSGGNGRETIRLGCCGAMFDAHETGNVVEYNLFLNCDGESEMIGMKSSLNTVRYNTIRASQGQISFRAGKKNTVVGNYILGEGKAGTNGIRMLDEDHVVYNNYVEVSGFPLRMQHGDAPGFPPIKRAKVLFNTFVVRGAGKVELGGTGHSTAPADSIFANNLILGDGTLITEKANAITLKGNS
jgi:hypothetical protein